MFFTISDEFRQVLKRYGNSNNGYVFLLMFRRKWLINNKYVNLRELLL